MTDQDHQRIDDASGPAAMPAQATLSLDGADLYYEVRGRGPLLLFIAGGSSDAGIFTGVADILADRYTVLTYDPRGNSRSVLTRPPGIQPIDVYAEDAHALLASITREPAYVFSSSSGALVGLELMIRHPEQLELLIAHEPPALEFLPDRDRQALVDEISHVYERQGAWPALEKFGEAFGMRGMPTPPDEWPIYVSEFMARAYANGRFFFEHVFQAAHSYHVEVESLRGRRIIAAGGRSSRTNIPYLATAALAQELGTEVVEFPGCHMGYLTDPRDFAATLDTVLSGA